MFMVGRVNITGGAFTPLSLITAAGTTLTLQKTPEGTGGGARIDFIGSDNVNRGFIESGGTVFRIQREPPTAPLVQFSLSNLGNWGFNSVDAGGGVGVITLANATTAPSTNPTGGGILYSEAGALKWRGSAGTVTVLGPA